ncbi:hypothetical protein ILUMI_26912 [Ignelater luminosus]|uniref:Uncharacterized protein n=1 Tax=Ignelater luminosus TaxID=2038154 RepID=A0A8K0C5W9_IGNLU|nr:hypothetical protein ILUMI_26912 [Ignelater luminosus]
MQKLEERYSLHERSNENGKRLTDFASSHGLKIRSTHFKRKKIPKSTWRTPNGEYTNQIDHLLTEQKREQCISKIGTYGGPNVNTDHFLLGTKLVQQMPREPEKCGRQDEQKLNGTPQNKTRAKTLCESGRIVDNYNIDRAWKDYFRKPLNGEEDSNEEGQTRAHMQERNEDEEEMYPPDLEEGKAKNQVKDAGSAGHRGFKDWELKRKSIGQERVEEDLNPGHGQNRYQSVENVKEGHSMVSSSKQEEMEEAQRRQT